MWCSQCQQDVPAVARTSQGPLVCSCCGQIVKLSTLERIVDSGIELESFEAASTTSGLRSSPIDYGAREEARERHRRIGRQLRSPYREVFETGAPATVEGNRRSLLWNSEPIAPPQLRQIAKLSQHEAVTSGSQTSWLLSSLLTLGLLGFAFGVAALVWSACFDLSEVWHWGMTTTIAAEGLLIVGLTWMAIRLWQNSRRLNHELRGVDKQLVEIHEMAGSLSAGQLSASQNYYHHFSQVANPHMLVANLRGQIDQLAERISG
ncbi:hypothetical protein [Bythopirellula polymerisocia]|uniref:Uncharacterized protein n=1 Tax=Bythopirellula polymerisocia TaxID=2528003 RepID=A0A5C6CWD9_9BACT|nr:hypothetical protein [Bythopirellula polymerisocia]TWU27847.1 hypothetical protein Pla144_26240 [Bythopirellula polymerisocia]